MASFHETLLFQVLQSPSDLFWDLGSNAMDSQIQQEFNWYGTLQNIFFYIYVNDVPWISIIDIISSPLFYFFNIVEFRPIILLSFGNFAIIDPQFSRFYAKM